MIIRTNVSVVNEPVKQKVVQNVAPKKEKVSKPKKEKKVIGVEEVINELQPIEEENQMGEV